MMSQSVAKATAGGTKDGLVAMPLWKQGIVNQGGPADISTRRFVAPADVDETTENPYAASNMVCAWYDGEGLEQPGVMYFTDGSNPYYPDGLCMAAPINLSARTPYECEVSGISDGALPGCSRHDLCRRCNLWSALSVHNQSRGQPGVRQVGHLVRVPGMER